MSPEFLGGDDVRQIHADQIARYGGDPALGDESLLLSAISMPQGGIDGEYFHADLFEMAAA